MFESLFAQRSAIARYRSAPLLKERIRYLAHCEQIGIRPATFDLQMKAKAMALCDAGDAAPNRPWKEDKGVIAFLNSI